MAGLRLRVPGDEYYVLVQPVATGWRTSQ